MDQADKSPTILTSEQLLLIDKPSGMTSHDVVNLVRRQTGERRVGHAGTLDPLATGLLIVLVGRAATKLQDHFLHLDKAYTFTAELGKETDTYDCEGTVIKQWPWSEVSAISDEQLRAAVHHFIGEYQQTVPAFSAVKQQGKKLYELARQGKPIELPVRTVKISHIELTNITRDAAAQTLSFSCTVECGSGTYIRSLAVDIGRRLVMSATVTALRRTRIGQYSVENAQKINASLAN